MRGHKGAGITGIVFGSIFFGFSLFAGLSYEPLLQASRVAFITMSAIIWTMLLFIPSIVVLKGIEVKGGWKWIYFSIPTILIILLLLMWVDVGLRGHEFDIALVQNLPMLGGISIGVGLLLMFFLWWRLE